MAKPKPITFHVPASAANLGPGYGVVGLALDLPLGISVEVTGEELVVERRDDPSAHLEDPRHDPVLRGLRRGAELFGLSLPKGLSIVVEGTIPRGTGMGTISAGFAAGLGVAVRLAKQKANVADQVLDALVELGGDTAHGAAALFGGLCATVQVSLPQEPRIRHRALRLPIHADWHYVIALPDAQMGTAETKRVLPPTLPHATTRRSTSRTLGVLSALEHGDEDLLRQCMIDEVHLPYRRRLLPGLDEALLAAVEAGAAGATICGHGPGVIAFTAVPGRVPEIARAMVHAFAGRGREATTLTLRTAHYGALPAG
ncbi:MAG: hypothetical protein R3F29_06110 [Planctomycetota bacterium]